MKARVIFLTLFLVTTITSVNGQVTDDFSDGNFSNSPAWLGDTSNFAIDMENQLQLLAPVVADQSFLSTSSEIIKDAEWSFYVKLEFNPSSSNFMDIYLVSYNENLKESLNGYFVRIGNTQDEVSLYKQSGEKSTSEKIIDGTDDQVDVTMVELNLKVTKNHDHVWELFVDTGLNGDYISEGTILDGTHEYSNYFGIKCTYSKTRSDKFFFDNLIITGESNIDVDPPEVDSLMVIFDTSLQINFMEPLSASSANQVNNYFVDQGIGNPYDSKLEMDSIVILSFEKKFTDKTVNHLTIHGVEDMSANQLDNYTAAFTYLAPYILRFGDVLISEIMADPAPGVDLPEYEYLEVFNPHNVAFDLNQVNLIVGSDTATIPDMTINPSEYIILCQHSAVEHFKPYGRTLKVPSWPSLNNRGENIFLYNSLNELLFSVEYDNTWYNSIKKDDGGWSLEMIDTDFPCKGRENWIASSDPSGGTPARKNASAYQLTDLSSPEVSRIIADSDTSVIIYLHEKISPQEVPITDISVNPHLEIEKADMVAPFLSRIDIIFKSPILSKTRYERLKIYMTALEIFRREPHPLLFYLKRQIVLILL